MIVGDSIVRHVRATLAEGKVRTHCFPGARILDVSAQIPAILKGDESVAAVVMHQDVADGDTEEGLQEPDRDGTQSSQVTFIYIALLTIQIVSKHLTVSNWRIECQQCTTPNQKKLGQYGKRK